MLSEGYQAGIKWWLSLICSSVFFNFFLAGFHLFHQNFCVPSIPSAVQFFFFLVSFSRVFSLILNSFKLAILSLNCLLTLSIHSNSWVLSSCSYISSQNLTNLSISGIWSTCSVPPSTFLKKFFWFLSKVALSIYYLLLSTIF